MPCWRLPGLNDLSSSILSSSLYHRDVKSPIIIQVSQGGSAYFAGKGLSNDHQRASIIGAIAAARHVRTVAESYGVYVLNYDVRLLDT